MPPARITQGLGLLHEGLLILLEIHQERLKDTGQSYSLQVTACTSNILAFLPCQVTPLGMVHGDLIAPFTQECRSWVAKWVTAVLDSMSGGCGENRQVSLECDQERKIWEPSLKSNILTHSKSSFSIFFSFVFLAHYFRFMVLFWFPKSSILAIADPSP